VPDLVEDSPIVGGTSNRACLVIELDLQKEEGLDHVTGIGGEGDGDSADRNTIGCILGGILVKKYRSPCWSGYRCKWRWG
jgi:hypothetical protein